jgi:DNA mismatch repair ATPase MutS
VRPEFTTDGPLAIKQGRNPLVEKLFRDPFIPVRFPFLMHKALLKLDATQNDTFVTEASNFHVITGPNMVSKAMRLGIERGRET